MTAERSSSRDRSRSSWQRHRHASVTMHGYEYLLSSAPPTGEMPDKSTSDTVASAIMIDSDSDSNVSSKSAPNCSLAGSGDTSTKPVGMGNTEKLPSMEDRGQTDCAATSHALDSAAASAAPRRHASLACGHGRSRDYCCLGGFKTYRAFFATAIGGGGNHYLRMLPSDLCKSDGSLWSCLRGYTSACG